MRLYLLLVFIIPPASVTVKPVESAGMNANSEREATTNPLTVSVLPQSFLHGKLLDARPLIDAPVVVLHNRVTQDVLQCEVGMA